MPAKVQPEYKCRHASKMFNRPLPLPYYDIRQMNQISWENFSHKRPKNPSGKNYQELISCFFNYLLPPLNPQAQLTPPKRATLLDSTILTEEMHLSNFLSNSNYNALFQDWNFLIFEDYNTVSEKLTTQHGSTYGGIHSWLYIPFWR